MYMSVNKFTAEKLPSKIVKAFTHVSDFVNPGFNGEVDTLRKILMATHELKVREDRTSP